MVKKSVYLPCDEQGALGKSVVSKQDFSDFCLFMSDQSEKTKAIRKRAYEAISQTGEATPLAKIDFVRACALDYFKSQLKNGNALSAQALSNDASEWDDESAEQFVATMGCEFRGLLVAVGGDVFDGMLLASSMTPAARSALVKALWSGDEFAKEVVSLALGAERGQAAQAIAEWRRTPEARKRMTSKSKTEKGADRITLGANKYGIYAPLLKFLTDNLGVAQRAEYFARFEDYANSGYLDQDLSLRRNARQDGLKATPAAHAWRELAGRVISGQEPQPTAREVREVLHQRLAQVGMAMSVKGIKSGQNETFQAVASPLSAGELDGLAVSGQVDAFTHCVDGTAIVSFASSNPLLNTQNAQWSRHFVAVENSLGSMGVSSASYRVMAPCLIADKAVHAGGLSVGSPLAKWLSGSQKISEEIQGLVNAVPFMHELLNGSKDVLSTASLGGVGEWAARIDLELVGSDRNAWPSIQGAILGSSDMDAEFHRQILKSAGKLLDAFSDGARMRGGEAALIRGVQTMDKSGPELSLLISFVEASVKACRKSKDPELAVIAKALKPKLEKSCAAMAEDSVAMGTITACTDSVAGLISDLAKIQREAKASKNPAKKSTKPVPKAVSKAKSR